MVIFISWYDISYVLPDSLRLGVLTPYLYTVHIYKPMVHHIMLHIFCFSKFIWHWGLIGAHIDRKHVKIQSKIRLTGYIEWSSDRCFRSVAICDRLCPGVNLQPVVNSRATFAYRYVYNSTFVVALQKEYLSDENNLINHDTCASRDRDSVHICRNLMTI